MKVFTHEIISLTVLAALCVPGVASAEAKLCGKAHLSFGSVSEDTGTDASSNAITSHASHTSRVGVKGTIDTANSIKAIYKFEWQEDMSDKANGDDNFKSRSQYVGLKDDWGQLRIGRDDSPIINWRVRKMLST